MFLVESFELAGGLGNKKSSCYGFINGVGGMWRFGIWDKRLGTIWNGVTISTWFEK